MAHRSQPCPLDNSRLIPGGGSWDISDWYCPRCDVAFVFLAPARSGQTPTILQWHRRDGQLELREEDRPPWEELPRQFREAWESNVRYHVKGFLEARYLEPASWVRCQMDAGMIPVLQKGVEGGTPWLFAWCSYCLMGFLFIRDDLYGWEHWADVRWDADAKKYLLGRQYPTGGNHTLNSEVVRELPPVPGHAI